MPDTKMDDITDALRQRISDGAFGTEGRLPSLRMLSKQYNTTRETMNKVVQLLQADGLLLSRGRAGVFMNTTQKEDLPGLTRNFEQFFQQQGLVLEETNIQEPSIVLASTNVAKALNIPEGTKVVRRYRKQGIPAQPYRLVETFYSPELVGEEILKELQNNITYDVLMAIKEYKKKFISEVRDEINARLPSTEEQKELKIVRNAPVFEISRISYDVKKDGMPIMFNKLICAANLFTLTYEYTVDYWSKHELGS